jgi:hypothetical protein
VKGNAEIFIRQHPQALVGGPDDIDWFEIVTIFRPNITARHSARSSRTPLPATPTLDDVVIWPFAIGLENDAGL